MKVAITVTAIYDFPDDIEIEDIVENDEFLGRHIVVDGRRFQPIVDFLLDEESDAAADAADGELEEIYECLEDSFVSEDYTIMELEGEGDEGDYGDADEDDEGEDEDDEDD
jgi:hypothetical protein